MYLGTPKDNMQDALREGTKYKAPCGENNQFAKLSNIQVQNIKDMKGKTSMTQKEIASLYNIHQSQISRWWNKVTRK
jgi:DNA-binding transcriptional regulator YiaG